MTWENRETRSATIEAATDTDLEGFYYDSPEKAKQAAFDIVRHAASGKVAFFDVDDTLIHSEPWLRARLNQLVRSAIPDFKGVSLEEVLKHGGRYYQVPAYQEAAQAMGIPFVDLWNKVGNDPEAHRMMLPWPGARGVQESVRERGYVLGGYPTARPQEIVRLTAASLRYHGFFPAPVIDTGANSSDPSTAKCAFFKDLVAETPQDVTFLFIDDHVSTAAALHEQLGDRVNVIVPLVPRNQNHVRVLEEKGIRHGTFSQIEAMIMQGL